MTPVQNKLERLGMANIFSLVQNLFGRYGAPHGYAPACTGNF